MEVQDTALVKRIILPYLIGDSPAGVCCEYHANRFGLTYAELFNKFFFYIDYTRRFRYDTGEIFFNGCDEHDLKDMESYRKEERTMTTIARPNKFVFRIILSPEDRDVVYDQIDLGYGYCVIELDDKDKEVLVNMYDIARI